MLFSTKYLPVLKMHLKFLVTDPSVTKGLGMWSDEWSERTQVLGALRYTEGCVRWWKEPGSRHLPGFPASPVPTMDSVEDSYLPCSMRWEERLWTVDIGGSVSRRELQHSWNQSQGVKEKGWGLHLREKPGTLVSALPILSVLSALHSRY